MPDDVSRHVTSARRVSEWLIVKTTRWRIVLIGRLRNIVLLAHLIQRQEAVIDFQAERADGR
jgi:hypothetical protein